MLIIVIISIGIIVNIIIYYYYYCCFITARSSEVGWIIYLNISVTFHMQDGFVVNRTELSELNKHIWRLYLLELLVDYVCWLTPGLGINRKAWGVIARRYGGKQQQMNFDDFAVCAAKIFNIHGEWNNSACSACNACNACSACNECSACSECSECSVSACAKGNVQRFVYVVKWLIISQKAQLCIVDNIKRNNSHDYEERSYVVVTITCIVGFVFCQRRSGG